MEKIDTSIFWNLRETLTHNMLFNFIIGNRGGGKTYGAKEWAIDNFIKTGEQFGYIRRYYIEKWSKKIEKLSKTDASKIK